MISGAIAFWAFIVTLGVGANVGIVMERRAEQEQSAPK